MEQKLRKIKDEAIIKTEIGSGFYIRLKQLFYYLYKTVPPEEAKASLESLKTNPPKTEFEHHLLTFIVFVEQIERDALTQDLLEDIVPQS